jgi:hypothetical protein
MGTWTMIKLVAALVAILVVGGTAGGYIWNYHHRGEVIEEQKIQIADFKEKDRIRGEGQKVITSTAKKQAAIKERVPYVEKEIDEMVPSGDRARALRDLDPYRLPNRAGQPNPPDGRGSGNRPAPGRPGLPGSNR